MSGPFVRFQDTFDLCLPSEGKGFRVRGGLGWCRNLCVCFFNKSIVQWSINLKIVIARYPSKPEGLRPSLLRRVWRTALIFGLRGCQEL